MYEFNYNGETVYSDILELDSLGQACIEAIDSQGFTYYLIIRTLLGESTILEYGPIIPDLGILPPIYNINFQRVAYSEKTITKIIRKFLSPKNKGKNKVEVANILEYEEALSKGINPFEYLKEFCEESNY